MPCHPYPAMSKQSAMPCLASVLTCRVLSSWMRCSCSLSSPPTRTDVTSCSVLCFTRNNLRLLSMICCLPLPISSFSPSLPPTVSPWWAVATRSCIRRLRARILASLSPEVHGTWRDKNKNPWCFSHFAPRTGPIELRFLRHSAFSSSACEKSGVISLRRYSTQTTHFAREYYFIRRGHYKNLTMRLLVNCPSGESRLLVSLTIHRQRTPATRSSLPLHTHTASRRCCNREGT